MSGEPTAPIAQVEMSAEEMHRRATTARDNLPGLTSDAWARIQLAKGQAGSLLNRQIISSRKENEQRRLRARFLQTAHDDYLFRAEVSESFSYFVKALFVAEVEELLRSGVDPSEMPPLVDNVFRAHFFVVLPDWQAATSTTSVLDLMDLAFKILVSSPAYKDLLEIIANPADAADAETVPQDSPMGPLENGTITFSRLYQSRRFRARYLRGIEHLADELNETWARVLPVDRNLAGTAQMFFAPFCRFGVTLYDACAEELLDAPLSHDQFPTVLNFDLKTFVCDHIYPHRETPIVTLKDALAADENGEWPGEWHVRMRESWQQLEHRRHDANDIRVRKEFIDLYKFQPIWWGNLIELIGTAVSKRVLHWLAEHAELMARAPTNPATGVPLERRSQSRDVVDHVASDHGEFEKSRKPDAAVEGRQSGQGPAISKATDETPGAPAKDAVKEQRLPNNAPRCEVVVAEIKIALEEGRRGDAVQLRREFEGCSIKDLWTDAFKELRHTHKTKRTAFDRWQATRSDAPGWADSRICDRLLRPK